ncbi:Phosphatidate cytidylyltransferase [Anatilimnocola aggregata]|uniref:Phosphatidate cytidylyltransferase n=1 Tax=Anatilimnocola aggregata TaxID=2528021 RepID=A0A517YLR4_9BACT|nr:CDP-archaeol synthase [Anatilimnocola aggregata]QDU31161.1 Phosphatidate cytidylyltransferase [Anatilimnocola aggregata]
MLRWRLLSSFIIIAVMLALIALDHREVGLGIPGVWLLPMLLIVTVLATEEVISLLRNQNHRPVEWVTYVGSLGIAVAGAEKLIKELSFQFHLTPNYPAWEGWPMLAVAGGVILAFGGEMWRFRKAGEGAIVNAALSIFAMIYVGGLMMFLAWQRLDHGTFAFLSIPIVVKFADTGAYTFGRLFGRHKMTPLLSPGKTWQGAVGGLLAGCAASWLSFTYLQPAITPASATGPASNSLVAILLYGFALTLAGMHGDLAESLLKRDMNRKDSSTWLPGLGGVLDIIDSLLIAAPVAFLFWHMGWVR